MKHLLVLLGVAAVWATTGLADSPSTKIIFDTDMVEDYDDVGALATLHALADEGKCEILATVSSTRGNGGGALQLDESRGFTRHRLGEILNDLIARKPRTSNGRMTAR